MGYATQDCSDRMQAVTFDFSVMFGDATSLMTFLASAIDQDTN